MLRVSPFTLRQRHFAWLLWLALLLPVAQMGAMRHVLLDHAGERDHSSALVHEHCTLCLNAAAVLGSAPPVASQTLVLGAVAHLLPASVAVAHYTQTPTQGYDSRAPPLFRY